jgi:hypothetical protein
MEGNWTLPLAAPAGLSCEMGVYLLAVLMGNHISHREMYCVKYVRNDT